MKVTVELEGTPNEIAEQIKQLSSPSIESPYVCYNRLALVKRILDESRTTAMNGTALTLFDAKQLVDEFLVRK
jgi:hypothetical protein